MTWKCFAATMRPVGASLLSGDICKINQNRRAENEVGSVSILSQYRVYLQIVQIIIAIALTIAILLQARGAGLGSVFGGSGAVFKTRRGIDKLLFRTTITLAVVFALLSLFVAAIPAPV
jgi:preprotein translocase subunit SecG